MKGIGGHQSQHASKYEWLTPPEIVQSLGEFDLDPCAPIVRPWDTAKNHFTVVDDGLLLPWYGRVWLNPPYGKYLSSWMEKMAIHNEGVSLIFNRTDTNAFHNYIFPVADSILFLHGRINFFNVDGTPGTHNGGAPSVLIAYGDRNVAALNDCGIKGRHVLLNRIPFMVIGLSPTWKSVVSISMGRLGNEASLNAIYEMVEKIAPEKIQKNKFYKEKIRQTLQENFERLSKGIYKAA